MRHFLLVIVLLAALIPSPGRACGPGVHAIEASRSLELLSAVEPDWAVRALEPQAMSYLWFGAISPDLQWYVGSLGFGHSLGLSLHLIEAAAGMGPQYEMFALGHLSHNSSDPSCEVFITPTLMASAPIGPTDLFEGHDDGPAESEGLTEVYGDLLIGDWDAVVDVVFDLWLEDEAARVRGQNIVQWYCAEGARYTGRTVDCAAVWAELGSLLAMVDDYLGGYDRQGAKNFVRFLFDRPAAQIVDMFATGAFAALMGEAASPSENIDDEVARLRGGPLTDPAFWDQYAAGLAESGPRWALDRYLSGDTGWPSFNRESMTCGNIQSLMAFRPEHFAVVPGLIVDSLVWRREAGGGVSAIDPQGGRQELSAELRFFSAYPLTGTVRGVVRAHAPGLLDRDGEALGEASLDVDLDPLTYVHTPRSVLRVPFAVDPAEWPGLLGVTLDLYLDDETRPWLTTSWERLWDIGDAPVDLPVYQDSFGTYGHWPPSLPVAGAFDPRRFLFLRVREAVKGRRLAGATVTGDGQDRLTGTSGLVRLELPPGEREIRVGKSGFLGAEALFVQLAEGETRIEEIVLVPAPPEDVVEAVDAGLDVAAEVSAPDAGAAPELVAPDQGAEGFAAPETAVAAETQGAADATDAELVPTPPASGGSGGCATAPGGSPLPALALLLTLLAPLALRRRRRR